MYIHYDIWIWVLYLENKIKSHKITFGHNVTHTQTIKNLGLRSTILKHSWGGTWYGIE